jgi:hypothetical protein
MDVSSNHWVDAVWHTGGAGEGFAVTVGQGGCSSPGTAVVQLEMDRGATPGFGKTLAFNLTGANPGAEALVMLRLVQAASPALVSGYGGPMDALNLPDCTLWSSLLPGDSRTALFSGRGGAGSPNQVLRARASAAGEFRVTAEIPDDSSLQGQQMTVQALVVDGSRLVASNGLVLFMNEASFQDHAAMVFIPNDFEVSIWPAWHGSTPVFQFGY